METPKSKSQYKRLVAQGAIVETQDYFLERIQRLERERDELKEKLHYAERAADLEAHRADELRAQMVVMIELLSNIQLKFRRAGHHMSADEIHVALSNLPASVKALQEFLVVFGSTIADPRDVMNTEYPALMQLWRAYQETVKG